MSQYNFIFEGKVKNGEDVQKVKFRLAKLFGCQVTELEPFFSGLAVFEIDGIDQITLESYRRQFTAAGCETKFRCTTNVQSVPKPQNNTAEINLTEDEIEPLEVSVGHAEFYQSNISSKLLKTAGLLIIIIATIDPILQNFFLENQVGVDIGYWPLILAHIVLIAGCMFYAKEHKMPTLFGLLGALSLAGLALLILIHHKRQTGKVGLKECCTVIFCCFLLYYWGGSWIDAKAFINEHHVQANALTANRIEFPISTLQPEADFENEFQQMLQFLTFSLQQLNSTSLRPRQVEEIANTTFSALARYQIWHNYQRYLYGLSREKIPQALDLKKVKKDQQQILSLINQYIVQTSPARLKSVHHNWFYGYPPHLMSPHFENLGKVMVQLVVDLYRLPRDTENRPTLEQLEWKRFLSFSLREADFEIQDNLITVKFKNKQLKHPTLMLAVDWRASKRRGYFSKSPASSIIWSPEIMVISPDFDVRNISGSIGVFKAYF